MQLIPDVSGNCQVLFYKKNKAIVAYHFNPDLQFTAKTELPVKFMDSNSIRIVPFNKFYLLYAHTQGSTEHELWKINAKGEAVPLSTAFQQFIDTTFKKNTSTLHLINQQEKLVIVSHTYYDELKILSSKIIRVDQSFRTISSHTVSFGFDRDSNFLHQAMLIDEDLYFLASAKQHDDFMLQVIKADLSTGKLFRKSFESKYNFTQDASFHFLNKDSVILVTSRVGQQAFISKLDFSLKEIAPPTLINTSSVKNSLHNFLLVDDNTQHWLPMFRTVPRSSSRQNSASGVTPNNNLYSSMNMPGTWTWYDWGGSAAINNWTDLPGTYSSGFGSYNPNSSTINGLLPAGGNFQPVSLSVADKQLQLLYDTVITNQKGSATVFGTSYASILANNKSYLILRQEFSIDKNGLLLAFVDSDKKISTKYISVHPKYEYLLGATQTMQHETLVMPFLNKSKLGLLKLSFSQMEN